MQSLGCLFSFLSNVFTAHWPHIQGTQANYSGESSEQHADFAQCCSRDALNDCFIKTEKFYKSVAAK